MYDERKIGRVASGPLGPIAPVRRRSSDSGVRIQYGVRELSPREKQIVVKVAEGLRDSDIAADLGCAVTAVRAAIQRIREVNGVHDRLRLVIWAYENGYVVPAYLKEDV